MSTSSKTGKLIVISGPSGVGKGTLCRRLIQDYPEQLVWSVSATSREPRPGEVHGTDYYFLSPQAFKAGIAKDDFLEWAEYNGNFYGTPRSLVNQALEQGTLVLLEIDVQGAQQVQQAIAKTSESALLVFIAPPNMDTLHQRLQERGTNSESDIQNRLAISQEEMTQQHLFDVVIVNDNLEVCYTRLCQELGLTSKESV